MAKSSDKNSSKLPFTGVKCDASNCVHHYGVNECGASCIKVGSHNACKCCDTECSTFEMRKDTL